MGVVVDFADHAAMEAEARAWLVRLDSDVPLTPEQSEALRQWMTRTPAHRAELQRLARFWSNANVLTELAVPLPNRSPRFGLPRLAVAASFLIILMAVTLWSTLSPRTLSNGSFGTAIGQQQLLSLSDGSSVQLNTDSQVQVTFTDSVRGVRLLRGEALFTVAPDAKKPFEVYAGNRLVKAVGTAFSVHLEGSKVSVAVTHGKVELMTSDADLHRRTLGVLSAGQVSAVTSQPQQIQVQRLPDQELRRRLAWHEGYLVFAGEPLSEVVRELNRYSPTTVEIADAALGDIPIGGRFKVNDLDAVLDVLHENFGIDADRGVDGRIRLESGPAR